MKPNKTPTNAPYDIRQEIRKRSAPKGIDWAAVSKEDWNRGDRFLAEKFGVSTAATRSARKRWEAGDGPRIGRMNLRMPVGLSPEDRPTDVAREHKVSVPTATKWLAHLGRKPRRPGRPQNQ